MSEVQSVVRPPWLEGWKPAPPPPPKRGKPGNPNWQKGMRSPNPAGRPPGPTPQTRLMQRMLEDADGIVDALVERALEGDTGAAGLILSRVLPALRAQAEKVSFDFDATAPVARQVEMVLEALTSGSVAPDVAKQIIEAIGALASIRATEELAARIEALEARSG